jgi:hypothetical protein
LGKKGVSHGAPFVCVFPASAHSPAQRHEAKVGQERGIDRYFLGPIISLGAMIRATPVWCFPHRNAGSIKGAGMRIPTMDRQSSAGTLRVNAGEVEGSEDRRHVRLDAQRARVNIKLALEGATERIAVLRRSSR